MKVRIRFEKTGALKYISHLDVMRYFQKLFRRAGIPVAYSEGFSPHQILSFSPPLPLGAQSLGEYADVEVIEPVASLDAVNRLNEASVPGIKIISYKELPDRALNAMAAVTAARYECSLKSNIDYPGNIIEDLEDILNQSEIEVLKKTKKNEALVDIRPFIYDYKIDDEKEMKIEFLLSAGSVNNLKPELIYKAAFDKRGFEAEGSFLDILRLDLYTGEAENLVSLDDIGKILD